MKLVCHTGGICVRNKSMLRYKTRVKTKKGWIGQRNDETWSECVQAQEVRRVAVAVGTTVDSLLC